jgi:hypothetical protein
VTCSLKLRSLFTFHPLHAHTGVGTFAWQQQSICIQQGMFPCTVA